MKAFVNWVLRHRKGTLFIWVAVFGIASVGAARLRGVHQRSSDTIADSPSIRSAEAIDEHFGAGTAYTLPILLHSPSPVCTNKGSRSWP